MKEHPRSDRVVAEQSPPASGVEARVELALGDFELNARLAVDRGQVLALLGPNGAGKSTLLRCLAGLQRIGSGRICLAGQLVDDPAEGVFVETDRRAVAMVFQDYLLFPHLSVLDNVAFGLRATGTPRAAARAAANDWVSRIGLEQFRDVRPGTLSGGQAQRAALARALATEPAVLLLDEPLAALDVTTRSTVRSDLRDHLEGFGGATVIVSHDPLDAFALADEVAVLEAGRITQAGLVGEVTSRPASPYVADLVGVNLLRGQGKGHAVVVESNRRRVTVGTAASPETVQAADPVEGPTLVLIRPRAVALHRDRPETSARNVWSFTVAGLDLLGDHVRVRLEGSLDLIAEVTPGAVSDLGLVEGAEVWASVKATEVDTYPG